MTRRLVILQSVLALGLGSVFFVPKDIRMQPSALGLSLPQSVGDWQGADQPITQGERDILGPDTQFSRKLYTNAVGDDIFVSIVMSGPDMNTSIHRPERCLPAQGWTIADSRSATVPTSHGPLKVTRLHNIRVVRADRGEPVTINSLNYYWFVGHSDATASHFERTWIDIRDRLLNGRNQQWAYVTVVGIVTKDYKIFGRNEKQTDELLHGFLTAFASQLEKDSLTSRD